MRIDAHQHFWRIAQRDGHWPPTSLAAIHRDFLPADLQPELQRCSIVGTVLVQSLPTAEDTTFLLNLAARHEFVRGVVGWLDLKASDAAAQVAACASHRKLKGLRPMLQDLPEDDWIEDRALDPAVIAMLAHGLCFDALVRPHHLPSLLAFASRHPALPIVIDHAAKPDIAAGDWQSWHRHVRALAALPHVHCKLSGLLTVAGDDKDVSALRPWIDHLFACFGAHRLMWGSDWPVLKLAGTYEGWFSTAQHLCSAQPDVGADALDAIFGGNARRFYRLD